MEDVLHRPMRILSLTDNTTAEQAVRHGYSKGLRHLRKHHRVSIGLMSDIYLRGDASLGHVESGQNHGDIFTKALEVLLHEYHTRALQVVEAVNEL